MATEISLHLPEGLVEYKPQLLEAFRIPVLATWDEAETYHAAPDAQAIADCLVLGIHDHLSAAIIGVIFREKMKTRDRVVWGKAGKAGSKLEFFAGHDFVIEINWTVWRQLSPMQRLALIDHELCHFGREEDDKGERKWVLNSHSIEEFGDIVTRWGLWRSDLRAFASAITHAEQLGMFEGEPRD